MSQFPTFTVCDFDIYNLKKETIPNDEELKETASNLMDSFKRDGLVFLKNTQLNMDMVDKLWQCFDQFREQPSAVKERYKEFPFKTPISEKFPLYTRHPGDGTGSIGPLKLDMESMYFVSLKEDIVYPDAEVPGFSLTMRSVWKELEQLALRITECIALAYNGDRHTFDYALEGIRMHKNESNVSSMRMIYYIPLDDIKSSSFPHVHFAAHCDYTIVTLILTDREGLQIKSRDGEWVDVPVIPGTCAVFPGTMFPHLCGKQFRALPHRVVSTGRESTMRERRSLIGFLGTDTYTGVQPAPDAAEQKPLYLQDFYALIHQV